MTENYTNREIDYHFETLNDKLDAILEQTKKTNGRVNKAEDDIINIKTSAKIANWSFGILMPIIISMGVWIFFDKYSSLKSDISEVSASIQSHQERDKEKWDLVFNKLNLLQ